MSHRAPKQGNRAGSDNVLEHARSNTRAPKKLSAFELKKQQRASKPKRALTTPGAPKSDFAAGKQITALFHSTFAILFSRPDLHQLLQTVKGHLFNRDYDAAFGSPENLDAYIVRWSPSRALCYRNVFLELCDDLTEIFDVASRPGVTEIVCMGGGAGAELVGAAAAVKELLHGHSEEEFGVGRLHMTALDVAAWGPAFTQLGDCTVKDYMPLACPDVFSADFLQLNVIAPSTDLATVIPEKTKLITLMFTTNELYAQSRAGTTKMLLTLAGLVEKGCLLVVLESAGSYSTVKVGEHTFSMNMLLEHTLLGPGGKGGSWELVMGEEARWYRLPQEGTLKYPLSLENMRYCVRVFRRL